MKLENIDIHELLPQQEPFIMVGKLVSFDMEQTTTDTIISQSNIFVNDGAFTPYGIIENIAQTCATRIGYVNKYIRKNNTIQIGFIGAIRHLKINRLPKINEMISTTIQTIEEIFGMTLVQAVVKVNDELIATAEMKIALSNIESQQ